MIRKSYTFVFAGILALLFFMCQQSAFSQKNQGEMNEMRRDTTTHQHGMMTTQPMGHEMSGVRSECLKADRSAGTALTDIRAAKNSSDPKVLKDALDKAEKQLSQIQSSMSSAMRMMGTSQGDARMQGGGNRAREHDGEHGMPMDSTKRMK